MPKRKLWNHLKATLEDTIANPAPETNPSEPVPEEPVGFEEGVVPQVLGDEATTLPPSTEEVVTPIPPVKTTPTKTPLVNKSSH
jgi:hypothetical protein